MAGHEFSLPSLLARPAVTLRAALGGLLVTVALLGVSQAYAHADRPPGTSYVVAARPLAPGAVLDPADLELVPADLPSSVAARAFTATALLDGAVLLAPLAPGEPLLLSQVLPAGTSPTEGADLSFAITTDRALGGSIRPGERVDLIATLPGGGTSQVADGRGGHRDPDGDRRVADRDRPAAPHRPPPGSGRGARRWSRPSTRAS